VKDWCLRHPWKTFIIIVLAILSVNESYDTAVTRHSQYWQDLIK